RWGELQFALTWPWLRPALTWPWLRPALTWPCLRPALTWPWLRPAHTWSWLRPALTWPWLRFPLSWFASFVILSKIFDFLDRSYFIASYYGAYGLGRRFEFSDFAFLSFME